MTSIGPKSIELLPFQKEFVETVLSPIGERLVLLSAAPGMGKTFSAICATALFLAKNRDARILILVPKFLVWYWQERLNAVGSSNVEIDSYAYRELLEKDDGDSIWPTGKVLILSRDYAKTTAIKNSLNSAYWDLIVIDEVSSLRQFDHCPRQASRVVMLSCNLQNDETIPSCNFIEWEAPAKRNFQVSRITFVRSEPEISLSKMLADLISLDDVPTGLRYINQMTLEAYNSSPLALETNVSRRIKGSLIDGIPQNPKQHPLAQIINCLENLTDDEKLAAFSKFALDNLSNDVGKTNLVVANYLDTLHYVSAEIEFSGGRTALITGATSPQDRETAMSSFDATGGFILCTPAMLRSIGNFERFERIILYDPLRNLNDQLLARLKEADPLIVNLYSEDDFEFVYTGVDLDGDELEEIEVSEI
jgi:putative intracellular protease/amidase